MKYIKTLPYYSLINKTDLLDVAVWTKDKSGYFCEFQNDKTVKPCHDIGISYGTSDEREPKFCPLHFFTACVGGNGDTNYKLITKDEAEKMGLIGGVN